MKKDPYKQSIDILNTAPFVNLRAGQDKTTAKSAIASSENSPIDDPEGSKKYTQKQFDVAVRMASHDSAELALSKMKEIQEKEKFEK